MSVLWPTDMVQRHVSLIRRLVQYRRQLQLTGPVLREPSEVRLIEETLHVRVSEEIELVMAATGFTALRAIGFTQVAWANELPAQWYVCGNEGHDRVVWVTPVAPGAHHAATISTWRLGCRVARVAGVEPFIMNRTDYNDDDDALPVSSVFPTVSLREAS